MLRNVARLTVGRIRTLCVIDAYRTVYKAHDNRLVLCTTFDGVASWYIGDADISKMIINRLEVKNA